MHDIPGTKPCCWSHNKLFTDMWVTTASRMMASNNLKMIEVRHYNYPERLQELNLPTLYYRRYRCDLIQVFSITN